jgi:hypothetical protein
MDRVVGPVQSQRTGACRYGRATRQCETPVPRLAQYHQDLLRCFQKDICRFFSWLFNVSVGDEMRRMILAALAAGGFLAPIPVSADAREDVISGMTRCAVLTDDRQWLDCYYGAAQPMRAQLGLPPAPQSQLKLLQVQPNATVPLPATVTHAVVRTGPPPPPKSSGVFDVFGGSDVVRNAPVQSYQVTRQGFVVTLPDGQVWKQTEPDAAKSPVSWTQPASSMRVTITQGALHTFNLVMGEESLHHKVQRVR